MGSGLADPGSNPGGAILLVGGDWLLVSGGSPEREGRSNPLSFRNLNPGSTKVCTLRVLKRV